VGKVTTVKKAVKVDVPEVIVRAVLQLQDGGATIDARKPELRPT
jgi:hypothetical protein